MGNTTQTPADRLKYTGDLDPVINRLCEAYKVGNSINFSVIGIGYEDCNVFIETSEGKYVAKIFSQERNQEAITRYSVIMEKAVEAGVNHPQLLKTGTGEIVFSDNQADGISMVLMRFVAGSTFLELDRAPNPDERQAVIEQAVKVNQINYQPSYLFDSWAIPNIKVMFERVREYIESNDVKLIEQAISLYSKIPIDKLPHCFVHGDFTKANVLKGDDGKIYILDFSVSNWYPRIQELAVIAANLLHDESISISLRDRIEVVLAAYEILNPLTSEEKQYLYAYALAGVAMEFMGAHQEKFIKGNATEETEYWLNLGRSGLRAELSSK